VSHQPPRSLSRQWRTRIRSVQFAAHHDVEGGLVLDGAVRGVDPIVAGLELAKDDSERLVHAHEVREPRLQVARPLADAGLADSIEGKWRATEPDASRRRSSPATALVRDLPIAVAQAPIEASGESRMA
jgi:hypothetical protein